jgi:hypothetical protein
MGWMMDQFVDWFTHALLASLDTLGSVMGATTLLVPDVTTVAQVRDLWAGNIAIANTCYVLAVIAAAAIAMGHETVQIRYHAKDLAARIVVGAVAANLSLTGCSQLYRLAQSLVEAVGGGPRTGAGTTESVRGQVAAALDDQAMATSILVVVIAALVVVLTVALFFGWVVRLGVLLVLTAAAPLALACHALPHTDPVARLWWRAVFGCLGVQVLQALTLHAGMSVFLDPSSAVARELGISGGPLMGLVVLATLLYTAVKIPSLMGRYVLRGGAAGGIGSYLLRVVLVRQIVRGRGARTIAGRAR